MTYPHFSPKHESQWFQLTSEQKLVSRFCVEVGTGLTAPISPSRRTPSGNPLLLSVTLLRFAAHWSSPNSSKTPFKYVLNGSGESKAVYLIAPWASRADRDVLRQKEDPTARGDERQETGPVWHSFKASLHSSVSLTSTNTVQEIRPIHQCGSILLCRNLSLKWLLHTFF